MKLRSYFVISTIAFFLSSISAFWMAIIDRQQHLAASTVLAIAFWITLLSGIVFCVMLAQKTKPRSKSKIRLLNFFKGLALTVIDTTLIVSILCTVLISVCRINITLLWAVLILLNVFTIEWHCLFSIKNQEEFSR